MNPSLAQQQQRMLVENAKRELRGLIQQKNIAEQGIAALVLVAEDLDSVDRAGLGFDVRAILGGVTALCSIRLLELQINCENADERIPKLEVFLKNAESNIAIPGLVI